MAKVMVVDDSSLSRRTLRTILQEAGHDVVEASEGIVALENYFLEKPDLVLLDLVMSGMYGLDVLSQLLKLDREVRVIVATADIQQTTRSLVETAGAIDLINKPFIRDEVAAAVATALNGVNNDSA
jgi:two-component system chemotaxis response regulator CheY